MLLVAAAMLQLVKASWKDSEDRPTTPGMGHSNSAPQKIFLSATATSPHLLLSKFQLFLQGVHLLCPLHSTSSLIAVLNQLEKEKKPQGKPSPDRGFKPGLGKGSWRFSCHEISRRETACFLCLEKDQSETAPKPSFTEEQYEEKELII